MILFVGWEEKEPFIVIDKPFNWFGRQYYPVDNQTYCKRSLWIAFRCWVKWDLLDGYPKKVFRIENWVGASSGGASWSVKFYKLFGKIIRRQWQS